MRISDWSSDVCLPIYHLLRFGADQEVMDSTSSRVYPGDGVSYRLTGAPTSEVDPGDPPPTNNGVLPNGTPIPLDVHAYVDARHYITGAPVTTKAQAIYIEAVWNVTPNLLDRKNLR